MKTKLIFKIVRTDGLVKMIKLSYVRIAAALIDVEIVVRRVVLHRKDVLHPILFKKYTISDIIYAIMHYTL